MSKADEDFIADVNNSIWGSQGYFLHPDTVTQIEELKRLSNVSHGLLAALKSACGYMRNASIDLSTGCTKATAIRTIEGGLKAAEAVIAKAEGR